MKDLISKKRTISNVFKPFLWSYDISKMDLITDKKIIITNVLNLGTTKAVKELFKTYSKKEIVKFVANPAPGEWSKKSLNFWSIIFDIEPKEKSRQVK